MSGEQASTDPLVPDLPAGEVFTALGTSRRGLPTAQARTRLEKYGSNELPRAGRRAV